MKCTDSQEIGNEFEENQNQKAKRALTCCRGQQISNTIPLKPFSGNCYTKYPILPGFFFGNLSVYLFLCVCQNK